MMGDKVKTKERKKKIMSDRNENRYPPIPLLQVSPPPPSTVRAAPRVLCLPALRPHWPLLLPLRERYLGVKIGCLVRRHFWVA